MDIVRNDARVDSEAAYDFEDSTFLGCALDVQYSTSSLRIGSTQSISRTIEMISYSSFVPLERSKKYERRSVRRSFLEVLDRAFVSVARPTRWVSQSLSCTPGPVRAFGLVSNRGHPKDRPEATRLDASALSSQPRHTAASSRANAPCGYR